MKIWTISDLHFEIEELLQFKPLGDIPDADVCVLAGDVGRNMLLSVMWAEKVILPHMPVVFVAGNHDYFFGCLDVSISQAKAYAKSVGVHFLERDAVSIDGINFVGGTLWSDYALDLDLLDREDKELIGLNMQRARVKADFRLISKTDIADQKAVTTKHLASLFDPQDAAKIHAETVRVIKSTLGFYDPASTVVVTHFAPHKNSIEERYWSGDVLQPTYVSDLSAIMELYQPVLWVHGHVHKEFDYLVGDTRVVCNPKGYAHEHNGFEWNKVVVI